MSRHVIAVWLTGTLLGMIATSVAVFFMDVTKAPANTIGYCWCAWVLVGLVAAFAWLCVEAWRNSKPDPNSSKELEQDG